jgi:SRSO17 transposase
MGTESDVEVGLWDAELESLLQRVGGRFGRVEPRRRMRDYVRGLLGPVGRKNSWQIAEYAGHGTPHGLQRLLSWCQWDPEQIRDDLQDYVAERLGQPGGVLIVDDTGFLKKGTVSAGVQRQYSGTAGARISITVSDGVPRGLFGRVAVPLCGRVMRVSA